MELQPWRHLRALLSLCRPLLQERCCLCGCECDNQLTICTPCTARLPWLDQGCDRCGEPTPFDLCCQCQRHPPAFSHTLAALYYQEPVASLIGHLKFARRRDLARPLSELWLYQHGLQHPRIEALVYVPSHSSTLHRRGFNQAELLARLLSRATDKPLLRNALQKPLATASQHALDASARRSNLQGAFRADPDKVRGRQIALVDDVITTASTVDACSQALLSAGAVRVECWSIARTPAFSSAMNADIVNN